MFAYSFIAIYEVQLTKHYILNPNPQGNKEVMYVDFYFNFEQQTNC